jgi:hypothetical protein
MRDEDLEAYMGHAEDMAEAYTDLTIDGWRKLNAPALRFLEPSFILNRVHDPRIPIAL